MNYLAIDVGGTFTKYAVITEEGDILQKDKTATVLSGMEAFVDSLMAVCSRITKEYAIEGIALSMPGMIDSKRGFMYTGGSLRFIRDFPFAQFMEERCHIPVTVENDAKCAALAELWKGVLEDCQNAVVLVCGTGLGGAVICDRKVLRGNHFRAGEFSYILTNSEEEPRIENALAWKAGIAPLLSYVSEETGVPMEELDGQKAFAAANEGDAGAIAGIRRYARYVAVHIHNCQHMFDPERFAIGGGISVQPLLLELIQEELQKINDIFPWPVPLPEVVTCRFFNDANLLGAVYAHLDMKK